MKQHILLDQAISYEFPNAIKPPKNCYYDRILGFWIDKSTGTAMMMSNHPEKVVTKKCDIETGEDQKGE